MELFSAPGTLGAASAVLAVVGAIWGVAADRIATRWPEHDEEAGFHAGRRVGWRTVVVAVFGAVGLGVLPIVFGSTPEGASGSVAVDPASVRQPLVLVAFAAYVAVLVMLLATDLDQRLMPDVLTLPMIPLAFLFAISGANPLVGGGWIPALAAAIVIPAVLYVPSLFFGAGAFGLGDVKLLVTVGLMSGAYRALLGTVAGVFVGGIVIFVLLILRRLSLTSYVPFGPFLILGALWAIVLRT